MRKHICMMMAVLMLGACAHGEVSGDTGNVTGSWGDAFLTEWGTSTEEKPTFEDPAPVRDSAVGAELDKDIYFHEAGDCAGKEGRKQVKKSELPCPICVDDDISSKVTAKLRGGTVIVRVPVKWMERQEDLDKITFNMGESKYDREEGMKRLADALHGEDYCDFLEDWNEKGKARENTWDVQIYDTEKLLVMNRRFIGNAWYMAIRPLEAIEDDELRVKMGFSKGVAEAKGDTLTMTQTHEWFNDRYKLKPTKDTAKAAFKQEYEGYTLTLYPTMDMYVAVVHLNDATEDDLWYLWLTPGDREKIVMNGYMNGDTGVFCGILTKGEAQIIMDGGEVTVENAPMF